MTSGNAAPEPAPEPADARIFAARLTPYRSLSPAGFNLLMMAIVAVSFAAGLAFWLMGAWPVVGFFGLDILLIQLAFRLNYRAARAFEEIEVTREALTVRKVSASGRAREFGFNPYWARLEIDRRPDRLIARLRIASHGKRLDIGSFLGPKERENFAAAFSAALVKVRTVAG
jgi:uncharacterized membrane protein